jgi:hypothetical protein
MATVSKMTPARNCFKRSIADADPSDGYGEGRGRAGRNGREHCASRRDIGPSIQEKIHRDNVGKGPLPAGAGSNLQRLDERVGKRSSLRGVGSGA